jgi:hypothetical protein
LSIVEIVLFLAASHGTGNVLNLPAHYSTIYVQWEVAWIVVSVVVSLLVLVIAVAALIIFIIR